jgi:magnesium chelatase subunit I
MTHTTADLPTTVGALKASEHATRGAETVKDELRRNLLQRLRDGQPVFDGIVGYEDTVVPQIVNAVLSRHNFILLGLRGQAKTRMLRQLTGLLDPLVPALEDSELNEHPLHPVSHEGRTILAEQGDEAGVRWVPRSERYVEKLATPDVTVADMIGDIDPIKASRLGTQLGDPRSVHYGLMPRANRGVFAINELPDLSGKVQVALFNVMQEGDVQIRGYPIRIPLDVLLVFSANPEDYTARGKIITPLKDRIGSEIRTHYPHDVSEAMRVTAQEAWLERDVVLPHFVREATEQVAFVAREDPRVDQHSGVSQRLPITLAEAVASNAERRALLRGEDGAVARVTDLYGALSAVTGKIELEYEGELKGGDKVARDIIKQAIGRAFASVSADLSSDDIVAWFDEDQMLRLPTDAPYREQLSAAAQVPGLLEAVGALQPDDSDAARAAAAEFILEGLHAQRKIGRSEERGYVGREERIDPSGRPRSFN